MSEEALRSVCAPGSTTSLPPIPPPCASSLEPAAASNQLELEMRFLVAEHRKVKSCYLNLMWCIFQEMMDLLPPLIY